MKVSAEPILVGCELFVRKNDQILLGRRKNIYGAGTWGLPGGHLEYGERLIDTICREAREETGLDVQPADLKLVTIVDGLPTAGNTKHYLHISFELSNPKGEPQLMEPEECEEWRYFPLRELPDNLFGPHVDIIENYRRQRLYAS